MRAHLEVADEFLCDGTDPARADLAAIDFANRHHLCCYAAEDYPKKRE